MRSTALLVFSAVCAVTLASAQLCTRETCPPGPVQVGFSNDDCTGNLYYASLALTPGFESCGVDDEESRLISVSDEFVG